MKVGGLFTDYDGTIAPNNVRRELSAVPPSIAAPLSELASRIPVAIITSKDYAFVRPRTKFASAWACCSGLEVNLKDGRTVASPGLADLSGLLSASQRALSGRCLVEVKKARDGRVMGFCLDWTGSAKPGPIRSIVAKARHEGFHVDHVRGSSFVDVYAGKPDKGRALVLLRRLLGVRGAVAYLGDSPLDNPAFDACDIAIGVIHGRPAGSLHSDAEVEFDSLGETLEILLNGGLYWPKGRQLEVREVEA